MNTHPRTARTDCTERRSADERVVPGLVQSPAAVLLSRRMMLKVKKLVSEAILPAYSHPGDAGLDVFACESVKLAPGESHMVRTGISIELPAGTEAQVRPRSGLAAKHGITVLNTPGTIDEGYRGEVCVILINHGKESFPVEKGMKIAQMVIQPVLRVDVQEAVELSDSARGSGGFGSTGYGRGGPAR